MPRRSCFFHRLLALAGLLLVAYVALDPGSGGPSSPGAAHAGDPGRVQVPRDRVEADDGDTLRIRWSRGPEEIRLLGVDAPEVEHLAHDIPFTQPFGERAAGFLQGALAVAHRVEILRAPNPDAYGRTLAYVFLDGRNLSALLAGAGLAAENLGRFGEGGFPAPAAEVREAAARAGPLPFEPPHAYRARMREVARDLRARGLYPGGGAGEPAAR